MMTKVRNGATKMVLISEDRKHIDTIVILNTGGDFPLLLKRLLEHFRVPCLGKGTWKCSHLMVLTSKTNRK